ncbi:hypothetical protein BRADI_1g19490v3 [Brachypodium distachyon]|uniref:At1g61320/AtMIF1 LRR domain-containing protein n=1 Tax=Brachypodium distachyon TaxID=15368 RepID=A0A0Q3JAL0_BRADI|nr:hypothetical protein BRADI_1g19490v3 [Brachypodium distachyon]
MSSLTRATESFLAIPRTQGAITKLQLKLYLINNYSCNIGPLVSETVDTGILKDLDLAILDEKEIADCTDEQMLQQAVVVNGFFTAYPSVLHCVTKLSLYNLCFAEWDMHHHLFVCCKQLRHLILSNCDVGLHKDLNLTCPTTKEHKGFMLSDVLRGTTNLQTLKLDFQGEMLWIQAEGKQLCNGFNTLRRLSIYGIFAQLDLLWTIVLLEAAPSLEIFDIEVWEHPCQINERRTIRHERANPSWDLAKLARSNNSSLKELQIIGFRPLEQQLLFIKAVMERAPNMAAVVLKYDDPCEDSIYIANIVRESTSFPV